MMNHVNCQELPVDTACLTVVSLIQEPVNFYWQSDECEKCDYILQGRVPLLANNSFYIDTAYGSNFLFNVSKSSNSACSFKNHFIEHGDYYLTINESSDKTIGCSLTHEYLPEAIETYIPLIIAFFTYFGLGLLWKILKTLYRKGILQRLFRRHSQEFMVDVSNIDIGPSQDLPLPAPPLKERLRSLDTFRGIAIVLMIFVNYGGGHYFFLDHLPWNGLSFADLVFPWFIWIMGVSMAISLRSLTRRETSKWKIFRKIVKRSIILFCLGIILNTSYNANDLEKLRIPGVLQRFAVSYFVVATLHMFYAKPVDSHTDVWWAKFRDVFLYWIEWIIMILLLILHTVLTFTLDVPGCPKGYLGPGGLHDGGKYENCTGGAAGYIDRVVFGSAHIYGRPTCHKIYKTNLPYDPEGLLGCITSIFLVFLGLQAGKILQTYKGHKQRMSRWLAWSILTGSIAAILCKASQNDGWIPVNKNLWSLSFILTTGCMAFFLLSVCYFIQDVKKWWGGEPFFYAGMNSILLYVGHSMTGSYFPWYWTARDTHGTQLGMDLWGVSLWVFIAYVLFRKKMFLAI